MAVRNKTVSALEAKRKEVLENLDKAEVAVGRQVLAASVAGADSRLIEQFNGLAVKKQGVQREIAQIEENVKSLKALQEKASAASKRLLELESVNKARLLELGKELYAAEFAALPAAFESAKSEAAAIGESISGYKQKALELELELEKTNFFQSIPLKIKLSSMNNAAAAQTKKFEQILVGGAQAVASAGREAFGGEQLNDSLLAAFAGCITIKDDMDSCNGEKLAAEEQAVSLRTALASLGVNDSSGKKRIAQLKADISAAEDGQKELCRTAGRNYCSLYCTMDGETVMDCTGVGAGEMPQIQAERKKLASYNRRIEILQLTAEIEEADRKIAQFRKNAEDVQSRIEALQEQKKTVGQKIEAALAAKDVLVGKRTLVEHEEGTTVKLLKEQFGEDDADSDGSAEAGTCGGDAPCDSCAGSAGESTSADAGGADCAQAEGAASAGEGTSADAGGADCAQAEGAPSAESSEAAADEAANAGGGDSAKKGAGKKKRFSRKAEK